MKRPALRRLATGLAAVGMLTMSSGVALMATLGQTPEGLVRRDDLPLPQPLRLSVCARPGLGADVVHVVAETLRPLLH